MINFIQFPSFSLVKSQQECMPISAISETELITLYQASFSYLAFDAFGHLLYAAMAKTEANIQVWICFCVKDSERPFEKKKNWDSWDGLPVAITKWGIRVLCWVAGSRGRINRINNYCCSTLPGVVYTSPTIHLETHLFSFASPVVSAEIF